MVVGAGIFRSASEVAANLPSPVWVMLAWALGGVFALAGAFVYAELTTAFPHPGGDYRFLREAFGGTVAWVFAWSRFAVIFTASAAMLAFVATDYIAQLLPMSPATRAWLSAALIVSLTALNLRGLRTSARTQVALVATSVLALLAIGAAGTSLLLSGYTPVAAVTPTGEREFNLGAALVFVMLAYGGFNDSATLSSEVRTARQMTRALVGGMSVVTALYLLANWGYLRALGPVGLANSDAPAADAMALAFGSAGETLMVLAVTVAALAILNALMIVGGRTLYAAAEDEPSLQRLATWDSRRHVPTTAVLAQGLVSLLLVGWGAWQGTGFAAMVDYMAPVYWLFLALTGMALIRLRQVRATAERPYRVPLYPVVPLTFVAGCAYVFWSSVTYVGWTGCALSFGMLAFGLLVRLGMRSSQYRSRRVEQ
jgi:amino acid transporter